MSLDGVIYLVRLLEVSLDEISFSSKGRVTWPKLVDGRPMPSVDGVMILYDVTNKDSVSDFQNLLSTSPFTLVAHRVSCWREHDRRRRIIMLSYEAIFFLCIRSSRLLTREQGHFQRPSPLVCLSLANATTHLEQGRSKPVQSKNWARLSEALIRTRLPPTFRRVKSAVYRFCYVQSLRRLLVRFDIHPMLTSACYNFHVCLPGCLKVHPLFSGNILHS